MGSKIVAGALTAVAAGMAMGPAAALDLEAAQKQTVTSCGVCHTFGAGEPHRQGPNLYGVFGRPAGGIADFGYSQTLKASGWSWSEETLDAWLENAQAAHPGTTMNYRQANPEKRALIIEYLKSLSAEGAAGAARASEG